MNFLLFILEIAALLFSAVLYFLEAAILAVLLWFLL